MVSNQIPLNEFVTLQRGFDLPKGDRIEGAIPVVASTGVAGHHNEAKVIAPGVVIGRSGSIGGGQYIQDDFWPLNTTLWVKDFKGHHPRFVYYLFKSIDFSIFNVGSGVPTLNRNHLSSLMVRNIGVDNEKEIAKFLGGLDDKIDLNKQTNQTLEKMAQALFKSWFVDFDPVFDNLLASADFKLDNLETSLPDELKQKAQRRLAALNSLENAAEFKASLIALAHELQALSQTQSAVQVSEKAAETPVKASLNANPKILAQHANTHAHFPNEFEHNEQLGWIPKGWSVNNLSKIAKFTSERVNGDDLTFDNYISTDNMRPNRGGITKASKIPEVKTIPGFHPGHILISNIRPYFKKIWLATSSGGRSNDVLGFEALEPKNTGYLFNLLFQDVFFDYMMTTSKGSKMPRGDKKAIMDWMIVIPPDHIQENYSILVKEFYKTIPLKNKEINILTELRDTLLPKLISGELQIPDSANVSDNNI
ncbi:restriction endonuclease subunit S [Pseudoalteromonas sp. 2CM36K]|uniref:restriction endonuclease subunit S n=1 Tax=Pseudoalteromonas sp. 2CM36K TaxID=2929854 RepID=UPI0020C05F86|nr:restriction endonuclease subunit S [Pseudoalteromonas sp. 2CM36K]MCK8102250.1 restriction endonuclease subunit S [Pseudoalteromonas sp. 2CM36K]